MNIIKYNSAKDTANTRANVSTTVINGGTGSGSSDSSAKLAETHTIFGQPFDGTQDVSGDITNVQNITAVGGDVVVKSLTDSEGEFGGNIQADKDILAGGDMKVTGDAYATKFIGDIEANEGTVTSISGTSLNYDSADIRQAIIDTLQSTDITTENLTVTKQAHFFELIIDKIKAAGGAIILSPADGFKVDKVSSISSGYRVYWKATDGKKSISNMWKVNDQAICQTFNAATGTSYNVSNKYYWSLVTAVGTETIDDTDYHYLDLSGATVDGTLNPEVGDEIAMLGYRGTDDSNRQSAIYIAAYNSLDSDLKAPLFAHYRGINDFNLKAHKYTWFAANGNTIKGNLCVTSGQTVEDYVAEHSAEGATQYLHTAYANSSDGSKDFTKVNLTGDYLYIGLKSDFIESDSALTYSDYTWSRLKGTDGTNGTNGTNGKDGTNGTNGVGIKTVTEYYLVSSKNSGITNETSGFSTTIPTMTSTNKYLWNYELVTKTDNTTYKTPAVIIGVYGDTGASGTSVTVKSTAVSYQVSASGTTIPTGIWQSTVPSVAAGKFLWTRTVVTYSDASVSTSYSVARAGVDGTSVTISSTSITYAVTTTNSQPDDSAFTYSSMPSVSVGSYLWSKTIVTYSNGTTTKSYAVSRIGTDGKNGTNGANGSCTHFAYATSADGSQNFSTTLFSGATYIGTYTDTTVADSTDYTKYSWTKLKGENGSNGTSITIKSTAITYQASTSGTTVPTGTWVTSVPTVSKGQFLWTRTVVTYSDNTSTTSYSVSYIGTNGTSITIKSTSVTYAVTSTSSQPADSAFTYTSVPNVGLGQYLWSKTVITYSDGTEAKTYAVSRIGSDGKQGDKGSNAYLHIAYATSADGKTNFSTTYFVGATYIGTYSDDVENDSVDYTKYTWARLKGDDGKGISSIVNYYLATSASSGVTTSTSGWTTTVQTVTTTKKYLWNYEVITYTDGTTTTTTPHIIGVYGNSGTDAEYYKLLPIIEKAEVNSSGTLAVNFQYQIVYVKGNTSSPITASSTGYKIKVLPNNSTTYYTLSYSSSPSYSNASFLTNYHTASSKPTYFTAYLYDGSGNIKDRRIVTVVFNAAATLTITDSIQATVQNHTTNIADLGDEIDNISVGGRNLIMNGAFKRGSNFWNNWGSPSTREIVTDTSGKKWMHIISTSTTYQGYSQSHFSDYKISVEAGKEYTISFKAYKSGSVETKLAVGLHWFAPSSTTIVSQTWNTFTLSTTATIYSKTFTVPSGIDHFNFMIGDNTTTAENFYVTDIKLEKGNKATDWTPSPEETDSDITTITNNVSTVIQKADSIESTVTSISNGIIGDNVLAGIGNGMYWTGYTKFEEAGFTFTFGSDEYLVSPVFQDYTGTYTLSFGSWTGTIKAEIYDFATQYVIGDNPDFSTGTKIAEISTADVDNTNPAKMHYDSTLGRYYFTFNESSSSSRTFRIRFSTTSTENYIQKIMVESGSVPHVFNEAFAYNQSQIKQTANEIELKVNDISIRLNNGIELNGDTVVNGSVTINDEDTGFLLKGNTGTTQITANSIGSYYNFYNLSNNVITSQGTSTSYGGQNISSEAYDFRWIFTRSLGNVPSGKTVTFNTSTINFMKVNSGTVLSGSGISYTVTIYEGDTQKYTKTVTSTTSMTLGTSYVSSGGEVKVTFDVKASFNRSYWTDTSSTNKPIEVPGANCNWSLKWQYPNDNFQMIGYDGHAINFGNGCVDYFGPFMTVIKYGNYGIKVSTDGVERYVTSTLSSSLRSHKHGSNTYTDTLSTAYKSEWCPLNGYAIRYTTTTGGGNIYIDKMDDVIEVKNTSGTVNVFLGSPSYFTGKRILIKKVADGGDMDVYAGYTTSQTSYKMILGSEVAQKNSRTNEPVVCRAYFSDGTYWIEEWLGW